MSLALIIYIINRVRRGNQEQKDKAALQINLKAAELDNARRHKENIAWHEQLRVDLESKREAARVMVGEGWVAYDSDDPPKAETLVSAFDRQRNQKA
jgi:hypothetical protein